MAILICGLSMIRSCSRGPDHAQPRARSTSASFLRRVVGECTVAAPHQFVDDLLDSVDHWSVFKLPKYLTQCSFGPKSWPNAKFTEDAAHAIRRTLDIRKDREPMRPLL